MAEAPKKEEEEVPGVLLSLDAMLQDIGKGEKYESIPLERRAKIVERIRSRLEALDAKCELELYTEEKPDIDPLEDPANLLFLDDAKKRIRREKDKEASKEASSDIDELRSLTLEQETAFLEEVKKEGLFEEEEPLAFAMPEMPLATAPNGPERIRELQEENERLLKTMGLAARPWGPAPDLPSLQPEEDLPEEEPFLLKEEEEEEEEPEHSSPDGDHR